MTTHVTKNALHFNHLKIYRYSRVPRMDEGRNGDIILVDTNSTESDPSSVGLWIKLPLVDVRATAGTIVAGIPGASSTLPNITINGIQVTFSDSSNCDVIADDINFAQIPNIHAVCVGNTIQLVEEAGGPITVSTNTLGLISSSALNKLQTNGMWAPLRVSGTPTYAIGQTQISVEAPEEKSYPMLDYSLFEFAIHLIAGKTSTGTIDITLQINGVNTVLQNIQVTNTRTLTRAVPSIPINIGDTLTILTTANQGAADLSIMLGYKYRNA